MAQNVSHAVMAQRVEPDDSLDDFPTPPWAGRALIEHVIIPETVGHLRRGVLRQMTCWEPAANRGYLVRGLVDYFRHLDASDIHDYGAGTMQHDFLMPYMPGRMPHGAPDWIITNPPFRLGQQFIHRALDVARIGCAMLVRTSFLEGGDRYVSLFRDTPPTVYAQFVERVIMARGKLRDPSKLYWDGKTWRRPSTATSYCWLVWIKGADRRPPLWIPPCRRELERPGDYPPLDPEEAANGRFA